MLRKKTSVSVSKDTFMFKMLIILLFGALYLSLCSAYLFGNFLVKTGSTKNWAKLSPAEVMTIDLNHDESYVYICLFRALKICGSIEKQC